MSLSRTRLPRTRLPRTRLAEAGWWRKVSVLLALAVGLQAPIACHRQKDMVVELPAPPPIVASRPAGVVRNGRYDDEEWPFSFSLPTNWTAEPGALGDALRVTLTDGEVRLEVWVYPDGILEPRVRPTCTWGYKDTGHYRLAAAGGPVAVATCTPNAAGGPRVLGYYLARNGAAYHLEGVIPEGHLSEGKTAVDEAVQGFVFR